MAKIKDFYSWMISEYKGSSGALGKLAKEMKAYPYFTRGWSYHRNVASLHAVKAGTETLAAFEEAWKLYEAYKARTCA